MDSPTMQPAAETYPQPIELATSHTMRTDDIYALNVLQPLLQEGYLPLTISAMRPVCLATILNDIIINQRKQILEFGSGISTLLIGRLARKNNLTLSLISIEHDAQWAQLLEAIILTEQLESFIEIVHAPLQPCSFSIGSNKWYDEKKVDNKTGNKLFDLVIIDGPPAYEKVKQEARYPAGPYVYGKLTENAAVFLDDAEREGERSILKKWEEEYKISFNTIVETLAHLHLGHAFNPRLF
jgi:predicted O-methyltransferase YrrM